MLFSSMIFLWVFLPFVITGNALLTWLPFFSEKRRIRYKNLFLLACSLFFYAWGGISYILIMLGVILLDFSGAYLLSRQKGKSRKAILAITVILNLLILFFFKYFNMLVAMIETVMAFRGNMLQRSFLSEFFSLQGTGALQIAKIVLPIGISFYTFQTMSYTIDVYRGDARRGLDASQVHRTKSYDLPLRQKRDGSWTIPPGDMVWTCFSSDFLLEDADEWRPWAWAMMKVRSDLDFFFITKRIHRLADHLPPDWGEAMATWPSAPRRRTRNGPISGCPS